MENGKLFRCKKLVRFQHCDPAGIVFYPQYFVLFHEVIEDWFNEGLEIDYADFIGNRKRGVPTVKIQGEFFVPSRQGDVLLFSLQVVAIGTSSIQLKLTAMAGDQLRVQVEQTLVFFSLESRRAMPVPRELRNNMLRFEIQP